jgi:predicted amidophosphoribosyltransferase
MSRAERRAIVAGAFEADAAKADGRAFVLIDDVVTTGATLGGAASALLEAGALAVSAITVARER